MKDEIREAVRQWRAKAESDWVSIEILTASERCPADTVCFHCQQYAEKLLKALLTCNDLEAPRTHDLRSLIVAALPFAPELSTLSDRADILTAHGVASRYPDDYRVIEPEEMKQMIELAKNFAAIILPKISD